MLRLVVFLGTVLLASAGLVMEKVNSNFDEDYGDSYHGHEMAPYKVDPSCKGKPYEKRLYPAQKWVSTDVSSISMDLAQFLAFPRLYKYIAGMNNRQLEINMTVPVLVKINLPKPLSWRMHNYEMSFYIPKEYQKNPPKPDSPDVYVQTIGPFTAYVKNFTGYANAWKDVGELGILNSWLKRDNITVDRTHFFFAGYNSPMECCGRRNEVWMIESGK